MKYLLVFVLLCVVLSGCATPTEEGYYFNTADPRLRIGFRWAEPSPPLPTVAPEVVPGEEEGVSEPDPTPAPPCDLIKGNISSSGEKIYHVPGGANYNQVKIDEAAGEAFFCTEEEAQAAGFRKARR
jgi:hypothetical protein